MRILRRHSRLLGRLPLQDEDRGYTVSVRTKLVNRLRSSYR
jgi:hypothetical protein